MNEIDLILTRSSLFWQDDRPSFHLRGSADILLEILDDADGCRWKVTWPDRSEWKSPDSFHSPQQAKDDLLRNLRDLAVDLHGQYIDLASTRLLAHPCGLLLVWYGFTMASNCS